MKKIIKIGIFFSLAAIMVACQKKKEAGCAEDVTCSYLLLETTRTGTLSISANTRAVDNAGRYTVNVFKSSSCTGTAVKTATFYDNVTPNVLSETYRDLSSGAYTVQATSGSTSYCSNSFSFGAVKSTAYCTISTSSITCY